MHCRDVTGTPEGHHETTLYVQYMHYNFGTELLTFRTVYIIAKGFPGSKGYSSCQASYVIL